MDKKVSAQPSARRRVAQDVSNELLKGLRSGSLTVEQAQAIAKETLATLAEIEKHEDMILSFYQKLAESYPTFKLLYTRLRGEILKAREIAEWKNALVAIESGNVAGATEILKDAIEETANETTELN
ncbi:hypothetical protein HY024_00735 [Candidatus Curtissbacteria bacterium]|nr:hypothetical protein [Candidatus Curtissbacteria bacterium]